MFVSVPRYPGPAASVLAVILHEQATWHAPTIRPPCEKQVKKAARSPGAGHALNNAEVEGVKLLPVLLNGALLAGRLKQEDSASLAAVAGAFQAGVDAIQQYGGASRGDRTMLDALLPAAEALARSSSGEQHACTHVAMGLMCDL